MLYLEARMNKPETIKVYKGRSEVVINKEDYEVWKGLGYLSSSDKQKKPVEPAKKEK